jgi:hypothetical protein
LLEESIKQQVNNQINEKIHITHKELAWQSEKCRILLDKIKSKFVDVLDCPQIILYSFDNKSSLSTFRTVALPKDMDQYKSELEKLYLAKLLEKQKNKDGVENQSNYFLKIK